MIIHFFYVNDATLLRSVGPLVPASDWFLTVHDWYVHSNRPIIGTVRNVTICATSMELLASNLSSESFERVNACYLRLGIIMCK